MSFTPERRFKKGLESPLILTERRYIINLLWTRFHIEFGCQKTETFGMPQTNTRNYWVIRISLRCLGFNRRVLPWTLPIVGKTSEAKGISLVILPKLQHVYHLPTWNAFSFSGDFSPLQSDMIMRWLHFRFLETKTIETLWIHGNPSYPPKDTPQKK